MVFCSATRVMTLGVLAAVVAGCGNADRNLVTNKERSGGLWTFIYDVAFAFPLPAALSVERFGEHVLAFGGNVDSHASRTRGAVDSVHLKPWIGDMQPELNRLNGFDRRLAACCGGIACDYVIEAFTGTPAATGYQRKSETDCCDSH